MSDVEEVLLPYIARPQFEPLHLRDQRFAVVVAHRRAGKTVACCMELIDSASRLKLPDGKFAYVAPFLMQAKELAWTYLKNYTKNFAVNVNESELFVEIPNSAEGGSTSKIFIRGADNPDRLRGPYWDGVVLDEFADMRGSFYSSIIGPALTDRQGWAIIIGTPKGHNEFWLKLKEAQDDPGLWFWTILRASETGILPEAELAIWRKQMTLEEYEQEFECSFEAAILGAYYGREMADAMREGRIKHVPYEEALPVHTAWDLGRGANMAVWMFQINGKDVCVIDHLEGEHADGIVQVVEKLKHRPYKWGNDYVPHDARAIEVSTGRTRIETLIGCGRTPVLVPNHKVMDGINAAKLTIPHCWFDREKCAYGIEALCQYHAEYDDKAKVFKNEPKHDQWSHSADAFRYLAMVWRAIVKAAEPPKPEPMRGIENITVDELIELSKPKRRARI